MRPLTEEESRLVFEKLSRFLGPNLQRLVAPGKSNDDGSDAENADPKKLKKTGGKKIKKKKNKKAAPKEQTHVFRLHKDRIFYVSEQVMKAAVHIPRKNLVSLGTCIGKFTHSRKFRLSITALDLLARYARYKVWLKPAGEQAFVYGNHIAKGHLKRVTDDMPVNAGVVVFSESAGSAGDNPIGFGVSAKSVVDCRTAGAEAIVVYRNADVGEYLREEADLL
jgi:60S ribosome subunit biogenesis protein NIP7